MTSVELKTLPIAYRLVVAGLAAALGAGPAVAQDSPSRSAEILVYDDANRNRTLDPGESGIADVPVSNGIEVITTDRDGRARLAVVDGTVLFVIKPSTYRVPVNEVGVPQFHYVHRPLGTPGEIGLRYEGLTASGALPPQIEFPLWPGEARQRFKAIFFANTQPQSSIELDYLRDDVVAELIGTDAAFGMTLGDIMYDDLSFWPRYNRIVSSIGVPWYNVPGNHDLNYEAPNDALSLETFKRHYGPTYYSFDEGSVHFVALDNVIYFGRRNPGTDGGTPSTRGKFAGGFTDEQMRWLRADLALVDPGKLIILAMHMPLVDTQRRGQEMYHVLDSSVLFDILKTRARVISFAGHSHLTQHHYFGPDEGYQGPSELHQHVLATVSGGWWGGPFDLRGIPAADQPDGTPNGYYVLDVDGENAIMRFKAASAPSDYQSRIMLVHGQDATLRANGDDRTPGETSLMSIRLGQVPAARLLLNVFDGGPRTRVDVVIGRAAPVRMERRDAFDPVIDQSTVRNAASWKIRTRMLSTHIWNSSLPPTLEVGVHVVKVAMTDEYGQTHGDQAILEVLP
ncbi:MAG: calcineurin-like phosphoesterase family protein [Rhodospirillaceae bacterium]|nr:calcineurin-like phosphoesterase family protein [Rhodospirillaceae bacterium]